MKSDINMLVVSVMLLTFSSLVHSALLIHLLTR